MISGRKRARSPVKALSPSFLISEPVDWLLAF
jgi:hypothetical protein